MPGLGRKRMKILPSDLDIDFSTCKWKQLCIGVDDFGSHKSLIEDMWPKLVAYLQTQKTVDITGPNDIAWFHLRRADNENKKEETRKVSAKRYEVLRIRNGYFKQKEYDVMLSFASEYSEVKGGGWWPQPFEPHHDNAFLSFLQKLSVLRTINNISISECLAFITNSYDSCPECQKAYDAMMADKQPWTKYLSPWFEYMKKTEMDKTRTHEYAHWFGHILSGWPNTQ